MRGFHVCAQGGVRSSSEGRSPGKQSSLHVSLSAQRANSSRGIVGALGRDGCFAGNPVFQGSALRWVNDWAISQLQRQRRDYVRPLVRFGRGPDEKQVFDNSRNR